MYRKTSLQLVGATMIALPMMAIAAEGKERPAFEEADSNGDGSITVEEATAAGVPEKEAKREDIDNDGELTKADWKFVDMEGMKSSGNGSGSGNGSDSGDSADGGSGSDNGDGEG